jgi:lysozyme
MQQMFKGQAPFRAAEAALASEQEDKGEHIPTPEERGTAGDVNPDRLLNQIKIDEGFGNESGGKSFPYKDTRGKLTVGYGTNLEAHSMGADEVDRLKSEGMSQEEAESLARTDIQKATDEVQNKLPWAKNLDPARQEALVNMVYNMGMGVEGGKHGLLSFGNTLKLIEEGNYDDAADAMLKSDWAKQVGGRARRLAQQMRTGEVA